MNMCVVMFNRVLPFPFFFIKFFLFDRTDNCVAASGISFTTNHYSWVIAIPICCTIYNTTISLQTKSFNCILVIHVLFNPSTVPVVVVSLEALFRFFFDKSSFGSSRT